MSSSTAFLTSEPRTSSGRLYAQKQVVIRQQHPERTQEIQRQHNIPELLARILAARGFHNDATLGEYLAPSLKSGVPHPSQLRGLKEAAQMIAQHHLAGGSVAIACDFDVDGLTGGSLLANFLTDVGIGHMVYVPDRFSEGYGLNKRIIDDAVGSGHKLLVTIDYGTTNKKELAYARSLGMKVIVVDHHHVGSHDPEADVFVNPQHPECGFADGILCAAGLSWYLVVALKSELPSASAIDVRSYLDLACLGTICDMVPLKGVNRIFASKGLSLLGVTQRPGLVALKKVIGAVGEVNGNHVGFGIGPRINAAGRMVNGIAVIGMLTTRDQRKADTIAERLDRLNKERQDTETRIKNAAFARIESLKELPWGIVLYDDSFHTGVIGIVAQRISEAFYRPTVVAGKDGDFYKGSVRGISGFSVVGALSACGALLEKFGGHEGAGGFSVAKTHVEEFARAFNDESKRQLANLSHHPVATADTMCTLEELSVAAIRSLKVMAPYGVGNPAPQIAIENLHVLSVEILKGAHLKVTLSDKRISRSGLLWRCTEHPELFVGNRVTVVCKPDINSFRGVDDVQLQLQAVMAAK